MHVYTGNGKGKTTAALGLCLRALGAGYSIYIGQFLKNADYSEIKMLRKIQETLDKDQILAIEQFGEPRIIKQKPRPKDAAAAARGWQKVKEAVFSGVYDLIIMEELNVALHLKLLPLDEVLNSLESKPDGVEIVLTGRYAHEKILEKADLVSEIREIKHYYRKGVPARTGIEK